MQPNQENNVPNRPVVTRRPINANARPAGNTAARVPVDAGPTFGNGPSVVGSKGGRKTGWVLAIILLLLIAAGGVGFGVWAYMDGNAQKDQLNSQISALQQQNSELVNNINDGVSDGVIDKNVLQNLINPYIGAFHYGNNIFNYDFSDDIRVEIAFQNLSPSEVSAVGTDPYVVSYNALNERYKKLFGSEFNIDQKDYNVGELGDRFYFSDNSFKVVPQPGGGAGASMVSVVKNGSYEGDNIVVEVYHDMIAWCDVTDNDYCLGSWPIADEDLELLINNHVDIIPTYKMTFSEDNGHYVLTSVEKM